MSTDIKVSREEKKNDYYFIYTAEEGGYFKGYRFLNTTLKEAKNILNNALKTGFLNGIPIYSILLTKGLTKMERIKKI